VSTAEHVAAALPEPSLRALGAMSRLLGGVTPGRLVVAAPWPDDRVQVRWLRDAVAPLLGGRPVMLLLGAPGRREARLLAGATGMQAAVRVHVGALDAETLAAAARCADVFIVPGEARRAPDLDRLLLMLTVSGVPVVAGGAVRSAVLQHESNGFLAKAEDAASLVATVNQLLSLPAVQRHCLGEEFAAYAAERWSWRSAVVPYVARLASLVGRPQIPAELRAAA
jgi:glycosyltransferase involved in cell wall biosynthesis